MRSSTSTNKHTKEKMFEYDMKRKRRYIKFNGVYMCKNYVTSVDISFRSYTNPKEEEMN